MVEPWLAEPMAHTHDVSGIEPEIRTTEPHETWPPQHTHTNATSRRSTLNAGIVLGTGLMPQPTLGGAASIGLGFNDLLTVELAGTMWPYGGVERSLGGAKFLAGQAEARVCPSVWRGAVLVDLCFVGFLGAIRAEGEDFETARFVRRRALSGIGAATRATFPLTRVMVLRTSLAVNIPLVRDRFVFVGQEGERVALHRASPAMLVLGVEVGWTHLGKN